MPLPHAVMADGKPLTFFDTRQVTFKSWDGMEFMLPFLVSSVTRPIVSVGALRRAGHFVKFDQRPCVLIGDK